MLLNSKWGGVNLRSTAAAAPIANLADAPVRSSTSATSTTAQQQQQQQQHHPTAVGSVPPPSVNEACSLQPLRVMLCFYEPPTNTDETSLPETLVLITLWCPLVVMNLSPLNTQTVNTG
jgi:hypothetical protein